MGDMPRVGKVPCGSLGLARGSEGAGLPRLLEGLSSGYP